MAAWSPSRGRPQRHEATGEGNSAGSPLKKPRFPAQMAPGRRTGWPIEAQSARSVDEVLRPRCDGELRLRLRRPAAESAGDFGRGRAPQSRPAPHGAWIEVNGGLCAGAAREWVEGPPRGDQSQCLSLLSASAHALTRPPVRLPRPGYRRAVHRSRPRSRVESAWRGQKSAMRSPA